MHCVYVGPQELGELLAGHESVGLTPALHDIQPASLAHVQAPRARRTYACWRSSPKYLKPGRLAVYLRMRRPKAPGAKLKFRKLSQEATKTMLTREQPANSRRRGPDIQGTHYRPQGPPGRPSHRSQRGAIKHQLARELVQGLNRRRGHARICATHFRVHILPDGQAGLSPTASRIQWYDYRWDD